MKKSVLLGVLGLSLAGVGTTYGQGGISVRNYQGAFNPVVWANGIADADGRVGAGEGVVLTLWYGHTGGPRDQSQVLTFDLASAGNGYVGYYGPTTATLTGWTSGETWDFQIIATGNSSYGPASGASVVWQESANIAFIGGNPPGLPGLSANSIGLTVFVPEPSTFALAGLGALGMIFLRRRSA
jgi:hypothetical protein